MQIVIDLPEDLVEWMNEYLDLIRKFYSTKIGMIVDAVRYGTPLPKGHGDLIDVSE